MTEPCDLTAVEARRLIGQKALSPVELTDSCIERIEAVDGSVNAMVTRCFERARLEAQAAEAAIMQGDTLGALHGLPLGVKDLNVTEGVLTTYGSPLHAENVPAEDERIIAALRAAGAIVIGKTNTPEFGAGANTKNAVFGATGNPFDHRVSAGGLRVVRPPHWPRGWRQSVPGPTRAAVCAHRRPSAALSRIARHRVSCLQTSAGLA